MNNKNVRQYGFVEPEIMVEDFVFGSLDTSKTLGGKIIRPDGQWDDFLPMTEYQKKAIETMNCSNFGTLNALEILEKAVYKIEPNYCERYLGVVSGTTRNGNSPHTVAEAIRKKGCIPEDNLPFDNRIKSWNDYYSPNPMTEQYLSIGRQWLDNYKFGHEWVFTNANAWSERIPRLIEALKYSPVGISVLGWKMRNGLYWKNPNENDNHWCVCYGYVKGQYWKIFDTYDNTCKKLEWNYMFCYAKKYQLEKVEVKKKTMLQRKKDTQEVFLTIGGERYWIKEAEDFNLLKKSQPIDKIEWDNVEEVEVFTTPYNGKIIGSASFTDLLKTLFGKIN